MDVVHHTLIGGAGFSAAMAANEPLAGIAFIIGSIFPDLDVIFILLGKRFYLQNHQGITHSLFLAPVFSLMLCLPYILLLQIEWDWLIYVAILSGIILHITLDWFNTFRIALFSPFILQRYSLDAVFFIDSTSLLLTFSFYLIYSYFDIKVILYIYPLLFISYFIAKLYLQKKVLKQLNPLFAIPSSINPFEFYILEQGENKFIGYLYNAFNSKKHTVTNYPAFDTEFQQLAETSQIFCDMKTITRAFQITQVLKSNKDIIIIANDIAVRNFGGKFARTILKFDLQGNLISEMAHI